MLVRRRVDDDLGPVRPEDVPDPPAVRDVGQDRLAREVRVEPPHLLVDPVERVLRPFHEEELQGREARDLPDQLRADRPSRPRDEDASPREEPPNPLVVELHRLPSEEVRDVDVPHLADAHPPVEHLVEPRDDPGPHAAVLADPHDPPQVLPRGLRDRDDDLLHPVLRDEERDLLRRPYHPDSLDHRSGLRRVVVHEAAHVELEVPTACDLASGENARSTGTDQEGADALSLGLACSLVLSALEALEQHPAQDAQPQNPPERQHGVDQDDGNRHSPRHLFHRQSDS